MHQYLVGQGYWSYIKGAHKDQPVETALEYATWEQAANRKPYNVLLGDMCSRSHARLCSRSQEAKGGVGKSTQDFRSKYKRKKASTPPRVEQHSTIGCSLFLFSLFFRILGRLPLFRGMLVCFQQRLHRAVYVVCVCGRTAFSSVWATSDSKPRCIDFCTCIYVSSREFVSLLLLAGLLLSVSCT